MRCGLFGKLAAKRDFIAVATPRKFLETWEPWVQSCMSTSKHQLGHKWQQAFLSAPVWRFWLGADICGAAVAGAIMPSVDGVGRYYPLTLMAVSDPSTSVPPPDLDAQDEWYTVAETFLLSTLDQTASFEAISAELETMACPTIEPILQGSDKIAPIGERMVGMITAGQESTHVLHALRRSNHATSAAASYWWTEGGEDFPPIALCSHGMPDPFCSSVFLTGKLSTQPNVEDGSKGVD
jgi:type VI secretion system protein ImpM